MTMPADLSLMDFLFEREDPMNQPDKDSFARNDPWPCNPDDFLDSLLKFEDIPFEILDDNEMFTLPDDTIDMNVANSICSDSGLSSDQQFSPMVHDADDEDGTDLMASTSGSEGSPNPDFDFHLDSPIKEEEIEIDSSVYDLSDTETVGDVIIEDGHDIDDMNVLPDFDEDMTVEQVHSISGQKLIRVTPVSGNPRSILLPVSMKDMKDIRAIKIFNSSRKSSSKPVSSVTSSAGSSKSSSISSEDESDAHYPRLQLTSEEKRLLQKEGVRLPTHYPLTKFEERELKRIRRKIRNKISAQDSRKRKKEYIDGLEDRVKQCTEENMSLVKKIKVLQSQNQTMMTQLKRLHAALSRGTAKTAQPATCLMVLMLSVALVMMPNLGANRGAADIQAETEISLPENDIPPIAGRSRTLLFSKPIAEELCLAGETPELEELSVKSEGRLMSEMDSLLHFRRRHHQDHDYGPAPKRSREHEPIEYLAGAKGFIVPPIDDDWPPPAGRLRADIADKVAEYANEFKVNISDTSGTRTVVLQVPNEK